MATLTCPTCGQPFAREESAVPPFCSQRCQLVDLHRWFSEAYSLPIERAEGTAEFPGDE